MSADQITPADAFSLLSHPTRIEILSVLMEEDGASFEAATISFSELYDRVEIEDSGQLNYHLTQLTDHFVEKTDDGYRFRHAGRKVVWAIRAGAITSDAEQTFSAPGSCYECGETALEAQTENNWLRIHCSACGTLHTANPFPAGGLSNRPSDDVIQAFDRIVRARLSLATDGVCIECTGEMSPGVIEDTPEEWRVAAVLVYQCQHCGYWLTVPFGMLLLQYPQVRQFYRTHGSDPDERPYWDIPTCVNDDYTTVTSTDPWRIEVGTSVDGEELNVTLDEDGDLVTLSVDA